jgi:peroxiredoxin
MDMTKNVRGLAIALSLMAISSTTATAAEQPMASADKAEAAQTEKNILIIEEQFFEEVPVASCEITGMGRVKADGGTSATLIRLAHPLPEAAMKYAISADSIPEATSLLEKAKTARVLTMSFAAPSDSLLAVGDKFPQFTATDIDGHTWSNKDVDGKPMVLNLWFTGCGPCRSEMPELSEWKTEMPDVMFFSATYEDAEKARPVIEKHGFNWIPLVNDSQFKQWVDDSGYPVTIVVDRTGTVTHIEHGTSPIQRETLHHHIQSLR